MKKVVVLLLLSVLIMRDGTGAGVVPSLRAAAQNDNNGGVASVTTVETTTTDNRSAASFNNEQKPSGDSASDPALAPTDSDNKKADAATNAARDNVRAQWTASLLARNPFLPFGATAKKPEKEEKKSDDDWASKKADELNLQSVSSVRDLATGEPYTLFSIEVISTKKRCWIRSDQPSDKVPFVYVSHRTEENKQDMPPKTILTVKNTITGDVMEIRQQERKKETSRGLGSYGGYNDYSSSDDDDDFLFSDFD